MHLLYFQIEGLWGVFCGATPGFAVIRLDMLIKMASTPLGGGKLSEALNLVYLLKPVSCFNWGLRGRTVAFEDRKAKMR